MTRIEVLVLASVASFSLSCADAPTAIQEDGVGGDLVAAAAAPAPPVASASASEVVWAPFSFNVEGCEETVHVEGFSHTVSKEQTTGSGGNHGFITVNAKGTGVGESGATYVWADKLTDYRVRSNGRTFGWKGMLHSRLIGKGKTPDLRFFGTINYVMNANGQVTVDVEGAFEICK